MEIHARTQVLAFSSVDLVILAVVSFCEEIVQTFAVDSDLCISNWVVHFDKLLVVSRHDTLNAGLGFFDRIKAILVNVALLIQDIFLRSAC